MKTMCRTAISGSSGVRPLIKGSIPRIALVLALCTGWLTLPAEAQYFGRNKVQYKTFQFQVLETPHLTNRLLTLDSWFDRLTTNGFIPFALSSSKGELVSALDRWTAPALGWKRFRNLFCSGGSVDFIVSTPLGEIYFGNAW